jgi:hypothetical protein
MEARSISARWQREGAQADAVAQRQVRAGASGLNLTHGVGSADHWRSMAHV